MPDRRRATACLRSRASRLNRSAADPRLVIGPPAAQAYLSDVIRPAAFIGFSIMRRSFRLLALALPLIAAACLGDPAAPKIESATFAPSLGVDLAASTRSASGLYTRDLVVGTGTTAIAGANLNVHYVGSLVSGFVFDDNIAGEDAPFKLGLGAGNVIKGWDEGLVGMKVGGRRQLIVPARLGYGAAGNGVIPPNAILVFTVDLVSIG